MILGERSGSTGGGGLLGEKKERGCSRDMFGGKSQRRRPDDGPKKRERGQLQRPQGRCLEMPAASKKNQCRFGADDQSRRTKPGRETIRLQDRAKGVRYGIFRTKEFEFLKLVEEETGDSCPRTRLRGAGRKESHVRRRRRIIIPGGTQEQLWRAECWRNKSRDWN